MTALQSARLVYPDGDRHQERRHRRNRQVEDQPFEELGGRGLDPGDPVVGSVLVGRAGLSVLRRLQNTLDAGGVPHKEVIDGFLLLFAGLLLIPPGFITGAAGLLLLLPPVRIAARTMLIRSFKRRTSFAFRVVDGMGRRIDIRDVRSRDISDVSDPPPYPPELDR